MKKGDIVKVIKNTVSNSGTFVGEKGRVLKIHEYGLPVEVKLLKSRLVTFFEKEELRVIG